MFEEGSRKAGFHKRPEKRSIADQLLLLCWQKTATYKHHKSEQQQCQRMFSLFDLLWKWCVRVSPVKGALFILYTQMKRIRSVPGNKVLPVRSSAIIHPTDQISTETQKSMTQHIKIYSLNNSSIMMYRSRKPGNFWMSSTCHVVMHPVQHDLWGTIPASGYIAGHLIISVPRQTKVQNLRAIGVKKKKEAFVCKIFTNIHTKSSSSLTFSSQSSFTARLLGFKSWREENVNDCKFKILA